MLPRRAIRRWLPTSTSRGVLQAIALLATRWRDDYEHWSKFWQAIANVPTLTPARINDRITAFTNRRAAVDTLVTSWESTRWTRLTSTTTSAVTIEITERVSIATALMALWAAAAKVLGDTAQVSRFRSKDHHRLDHRHGATRVVVERAATPPVVHWKSSTQRCAA